VSSNPTHRTTPAGIAYDDVGTGDTALLFLPGWCGPREVFDPLVSRLAPGIRCLAVDWRGHGDSAPADGDFGLAELVDDAVSVIDDSGVGTVVPVSIAHAGWVSIELRRRLGPDRVPRLAVLDWMVLGAPEPFLGALGAMADPASTRPVVEQVSSMWTAGLDIPELGSYVASMTGYPDGMWARAAREIAGAFARHPVPLAAIDGLDPAPEVVHLYAQPADPGFLAAQQEFAQSHPWFGCERLEAASHFPMYEVPDTIAARLAAFAGRA
jgi:pimeloyl-ACP methyl ester carboxylesterase